MNILKKILIVGLIALIGFVSGCMTIKGAAADIEAGAGLVKRSIQPEYDK